MAKKTAGSKAIANAKPRVAPKPKELFAVQAEYVPGSAGFLWTLHKSNDLVATGAQPYETTELAIAAAHDFLKSI